MSSVSSTDGGYQFYQRSLSDLEKEMRGETDRARERYDQRADKLEKGFNESIAKRDQENVEVADGIRDQMTEQLQRVRDNARADVDREKAQNYDKFGKTQAEINYHQKRADIAIQQAREEADKREAGTALAAERATEKVDHAANDRIYKNAELQHESRTRETDQLRQTMKNLLDEEKTYVKEKGQGRAEARQEVEDEYRTRQTLMQDGYEKQIDKLKKVNYETERMLAHEAERNQHERNQVYEGLLHNVTQEREAERKQLNRANEHLMEQHKLMSQKQSELAEHALENQEQRLNEASQEALQKQATLFRQESANQKAESDSTIERLENQITIQRTSTDGSQISPAAEEGMRAGFTKEYEAKHRAELTRDKDKNDSVQREYVDRLNKTITNADNRVAQTEMQRRSDEHEQRQAYLNHVNELQDVQAQTLRNKDDSMARQTELMNRTHTGELERQRRDYELLLSQTRTDSSDKITNLRQQAEFDAKMAQRTFSAQQSELIRSNEKKLEEQKNFYEDVIANMREQLAHSTSENDKRTRQLVDDQQRGYEQKIAQMEFQSKERERTMSENYQDQMEKLKRSNALLIQRKSEKS